jgi:hypothetical protein
MLLWTIILFPSFTKLCSLKKKNQKKRSFWKLQTFPNMIVSKMLKYINFRWFWIFHPFEVVIRTTLNPNTKLHPIIPSFAQNTSPLPSQVMWDLAKKLSLVESWVCVCQTTLKGCISMLLGALGPSWSWREIILAIYFSKCNCHFKIICTPNLEWFCWDNFCDFVGKKKLKKIKEKSIFF